MSASSKRKPISPCLSIAAVMLESFCPFFSSDFLPRGRGDLTKPVNVRDDLLVLDERGEAMPSPTEQ